MTKNFDKSEQYRHEYDRRRKERIDMVKRFKEKHPDAIILVRMGDFYGTYGEDAKTIANLLGITLTRTTEGEDSAAFPHYALDTYLPKLIRAGRRVAICDDVR